MSELKTYDPTQWPLFVQAMKLLQPARSVLDVGAGIRPQRILTCERHVCVEPFKPYADVLRENGFEVAEATDVAVCTMADAGDVFDTIVALDVIEHMTSRDGFLFISRAMEHAKNQVVIFTPYGFMPQTGDEWGMGGEKWQRHRSGWYPQMFIDPGWQTLVDPAFHGPLQGAFFAIWTRP